jgi:hypothetical protein
MALQRHKEAHLPATLSKAHAADEVARADELLAEARRLKEITMGLLGRAVQANDLRTALAAVREARGNLELIGRLLDEPGSLVLLLSPTLRQSGELFKKCAGVYQALGRPVPSESESALQLQGENGSRIVSMPGKEGTIRGYSGVRLLAVDEAAWVEDSLYMAVRPMLAVSAGRLVALSTPHGTRGWFYEAWRGNEPWERYEVSATSCPRISAAFLEEERRTMGEWWFEQEYMCRFLDAQTQPFGRDDVERCFREEVESWDL